MAGQSKQSSRNRKIEPLNWAETANSPALKGMMSFLDITSEEVRSGHFKDMPQDPIEEGEALGADTLDASDHVLGEKSATHPKTIVEIRKKIQKAPAAISPDQLSQGVRSQEKRGDMLTGFAALPVSVSPTGSRVVFGSVPCQNRKIRKCRLSQDGHSAGEEMLYRILWEESRPESENPLGSRVVRIG